MSPDEKKKQLLKDWKEKQKEFQTEEFKRASELDFKISEEAINWFKNSR